MGIFAFNIHESIKEDFIKYLQQQTKSQGFLFAVLILLTFVGLIGADLMLGWTSLLLVWRIVPIIFAGFYLIYNKFLSEKFERFFNLIYSLLVLSVIFSASISLYQVFGVAHVAPLNKLGCTIGLSLAMLTSFLFAGVAILHFLWLTGVPLSLAAIGVYLHGHAGVTEWSMLAIPVAVFGILALLSGEQFLLRTKFFAVQRRNQSQSTLLEELKSSFAVLREENLFLVEQLKSNTTFDALTAVFNKPAGLELLEKEFYFAQRNSEPMTIAYIRVNNIPWLVGEYGQEFANKVILTIIQILKETMRKSDLIIRYETDDFLIIFRQCEAGAAKKVITRAKGRAAGLSSQSDIEVAFTSGFADTEHVEFTNVIQMIEVAQREMLVEKEKLEVKTNETSGPNENVDSAESDFFAKFGGAATGSNATDSATVDDAESDFFAKFGGSSAASSGSAGNAEDAESDFFAKFGGAATGSSATDSATVDDAESDFFAKFGGSTTGSGAAEAATGHSAESDFFAKFGESSAAAGGPTSNAEDPESDFFKKFGNGGGGSSAAS